MLFIRKYNALQLACGVFRNIELHLAHYSNGQLGIQLTCAMEDEPEMQEPLATCTIALETPCPPNAVWVKDYSENAGMLSWMVQNGIVERAACAWVNSGYVNVSAHHLTARFMLEVGDALNREGKRETVEEFLRNEKKRGQ